MVVKFSLKHQNSKPIAVAAGEEPKEKFSKAAANEADTLNNTALVTTLPAAGRHPQRRVKLWRLQSTPTLPA